MNAARYFSDRYATFVRDFRRVQSGILGRNAPPFVVRAPGRSAEVGPASLLSPRRVRVARVTRETADAVSLELADPTGAPFVFAPGQFLTVVLTLGRVTMRRAYSISSSALETDRVTITSKRVAGGLVSNHLNDVVREGDELAVLGPSGNFGRAAASAGAGHLVLVAGGSGITPMMSIVRTLLATSSSARISLVYGNRGKADIVFRDALDDLAVVHEDRFQVRHVLSNPPNGFSGDVGVLDRAMVARQIDALSPPVSSATEYFVCGPEPMMIEARAALEARGVSSASIHEERFHQPHLRAAADSSRQATSAVVTVRAKGRAHEVTVAAGATLLEAGIAAGIAMPYSCAMGGCGACKVKVVSGVVDMEEPNCLSKAERGEGEALACVGRPVGPVVVEVP